MLHTKIIKISILAISCLIVSCGKSPLFNSNEVNPSEELTSGTSKLNSTTNLKNLHLNATLITLKTPRILKNGDRHDAEYYLAITEPVTSVISRRTNDYVIEVKPTMPKMGHGTTPANVIKYGHGLYKLSSINLMMEGLWLIEINFRSVKTNKIVDTLSFTVTIKKEK